MVVEGGDNMGDIQTEEIKNVISDAFRAATKNYATKEDLVLLRREINQFKNRMIIQFGILSFTFVVALFLSWLVK